MAFVWYAQLIGLAAYQNNECETLSSIYGWPQFECLTIDFWSVDDGAVTIDVEYNFIRQKAIFHPI